MKLVKLVAGSIAVLFSVQPLLSWAANSDQSKSSKSGKDIQISKPSQDGKSKTVKAPTCGG